MIFRPLPRNHVKPVIPPIKCQGIKTRLVGFILENIQWADAGRWVEPFLGSGVVLFSVQPERAIVNDINPHIVNFYRCIADGSLTPAMVREHLTQEGEKLEAEGENYYYEVRRRFNQTGGSLDFLFLSRACFNGVMRFNRKGEFNVPFCRKPERFRTAYITKIVNQVIAVRKVMFGKEWDFRCGAWRDCFRDLTREDFVYLDPPYIGRHTDYFNQWSESEAFDLAQAAQALPCGFALSMWKENEYRANEYLQQWTIAEERTVKHFYHVGSTEDLRHEMEEALLIRRGYAATQLEKSPEQLALQANMFA
jgi:DNA adenine methylase